jgi:hypothetical protein
MSIEIEVVAAGPPGPRGYTGNTGPTGPQGAKGDKGDTGNTGAKGDKGDTGNTGAKGDKGDTGNTGAKGDKGDTGAKGDKGDTGNTGAKGDKGDQGDQGVIGPTPSLSIGTVGTGAAAASLTGTSEAPVLNLTLPSAGANGVGTAAIQDSAVTSAKIADGTIATGDIADGAVTVAKLGSDVRIGNLLTLNQATGTDASGDTTGFGSTYQCTLARTTARAVEGSGALRATLTSSSGGCAFYTPLGTSGVPVVAGQTYTALASSYATGTATARLSVRFYTSGGVSLGDTNPTPQSATGAWVNHSLTLVAPATAAYATLMPNSTAGTSGDTVDWDALSFHRGAAGKWSLPGTPVVGQSHIATNGALHLSGTGSPEGVVTAAPGSTWLQTDATTDVKGWIRWVKATGTGNTGWVAGAEADTGWRNVTADLLTANGFAAVTGMFVRRVGATVELSVAGLARGTGGAGNFYTLPDGFKATRASYVRSYSDNPGYVYAANAYISMASTSEAGVGFTFLTSDAWPSALPGS